MKGKILIWGIAAVIIITLVFASITIFKNYKSEDDEKIKIAYICKQLSNSWFQEVTTGISNTCKKYDIDYMNFDANFDDIKCMSYIDDAIKWGANGILICTTNQQLGPEIAQKCKDSDVVLVTIDDSMTDKNGANLPHIGMATTELCIMGGSAIAKMANEKEFFAEGNIVKVLQIDVPTLSVMQERNAGYEEALKAQTLLKKEDFIVIDSPTGMIEENLTAVRNVLKNTGDTTHWIITGGNDESALSLVYVLRELGVPEENMIACGLGLSARTNVVREFLNGNRNYISIAAQPQLEGEKGVEMIYKDIVDGIKPKTMTVIGGQIITMDNYKIFIDNK